MTEISAEELKNKLDNGDQLTVVDVREPHEAYISDPNIDKISIPFDELTDRIDELDKNDTIVCICRSGNTSADACKLLEKHDFKNTLSLSGGINEWAKKIDPSLPVY